MQGHRPGINVVQLTDEKDKTPSGVTLNLCQLGNRFHEK
jgi:L-aminopeptidase/D-esterase-like protein